MSLLPSFQLSVAPAQGIAAGPSAPPSQLCFDLGIPEDTGITGPRNSPQSVGVAGLNDPGTPGSPCDGPRSSETPATSKRKGSFNWDRENGWALKWACIAEFEAWLKEEQLTKSIEFVLSSTKPGKWLWAKRWTYVCSRQMSGGNKKYEKRHPDWQRKIDSKKTGCRSQIEIKHYPHTLTILGRYAEKHDHEIQLANVAYTRLSQAARDQIKVMLKQKVDQKEIVRVIRDLAPHGSRDRFISPSDVSKMGRSLLKDEICLHPEDAISIKLWIDKIRDQDALIFYKDRLDPAPDGSGLQDQAFVMCIQTGFQMDAFRSLGDFFLGIDATHNVTQYENYLLFTIIARDKWGHGVPVAWMLTSNGTTENISFFVKWVRDASPEVRPAVIMTDCDQAQINALEIVYPQSQIFLCHWHVLRAIRSHFVTTEFEALWQKIKALITTDNQATFDGLWYEIGTDPSVPPSVVKYLNDVWMKRTHMWSKTFRKNRSIFQEGDTNMLIEAYHHVLKSHWLEGKRNRRIDHLIHTLVIQMVPYYQNRHERQIVGLEGPDLAGQRQRQLLSSARDTFPDSIQQFDDITFHVASESRPGSYYEIDLHRGTCNCPDFPRVRYCKHLAAISVHFPHLCTQDKPSRDLEFWGAPDPPKRVPNPKVHPTSNTQGSVQTLMKDIMSLSQELNDKIKDKPEEPDPAVMQAVRSVKHTLTAAIASIQGTRALPNKENIPPNQRTWTETAERMGVKHVPKRRLPDEIGLTHRSIGLAKGKRRRLYEDPYAGGERSGKHAKPDARSAPANARVHQGPPLAGVPLPPGPFPPGPFPPGSPAYPALRLAGVPGPLLPGPLLPGPFPPPPSALAPPAFPFPPGPTLTRPPPLAPAPARPPPVATAPAHPAPLPPTLPFPYPARVHPSTPVPFPLTAPTVGNWPPPT